ncbi:MAG: 50S ribosomal protein L29 [Acidobacteriota bacterium]|nr:50S ribosomal protein L29 [Acidobacteriota bacterium]
MKAQELRELTIGDLRQKEEELAEQLFALRLQKVTGQLDNPAKLRAARRDLARVLTVAHQKAAGEGA